MLEAYVEATSGIVTDSMVAVCVSWKDWPMPVVLKAVTVVQSAPVYGIVTAGSPGRPHSRAHVLGETFTHRATSSVDTDIHRRVEALYDCLAPLAYVAPVVPHWLKT